MKKKTIKKSNFKYLSEKKAVSDKKKRKKKGNKKKKLSEQGQNLIENGRKTQYQYP
jgi:hypothetical protein